MAIKGEFGTVDSQQPEMNSKRKLSGVNETRSTEQVSPKA